MRPTRSACTTNTLAPLSLRMWLTSSDLRCVLIMHHRAPIQRVASMSSSTTGSLCRIECDNLASAHPQFMQGGRTTHVPSEKHLSRLDDAVKLNRRFH